MSHHDRFRWPGDPDVGEQVLRRASSLKIEMYRDTDGDIIASYQISGDCSSTDGKADGRQLLKDLLAAFAEKPCEGCGE